MPSPADIARAEARRVRVVELIAESLTARGYPPSVSELAAATGVSTRQTRVDLTTLEAAGIIERDPGVPRGIRLNRPRPARRRNRPTATA